MWLRPTKSRHRQRQPPANNEARKGLLLGLVIGGVCAVALLLLVGGGIAAIFLLGNRGDEVAQAPPAATAAMEAPPAEPEAAEEQTDATSSDDDDGDDPALVPPNAEATPVAATTTDVELSAEPEADAPESDQAAGDVAAVEPQAPDSGDASDEPMPSETSAVADDADSTSTEPASPAPSTDAPADDKPEPTEKPPAKKEKPPAKKAPPKPKTFNIAKAIDLPAVTADAAELTMGQINIRPEDAVFISLDGGDIAASGRIEFSLQNAQDGVAPRDWEFYLADGNADPVVIATMSMPEKELKFKWTTASTELATATNLRNCSIRITAGQVQPHDVALRKPQSVAPVTIDLERSATVKLPLEGAPDRNSLKMEVTVKGHKSMMEPAQIGLGKGGDGMIFFGENREQSALALKLSASINARGVQIKTDPFFLVPVEKSPVRLNKGSIKKYEAAQAQQAVLQNQVFEGERAVKDPKVPAPQKQRMQAALAQIKQQLELINKTVEKVAKVKSDMAAVSSGATLHFRVFSDTFDKQIDLIVTDAKAVPVAP